MDRLNLSSTDADTRVGRAINRAYRKITTAIGMQLSRRSTVQQAVTIGVATVTFTNVEKIITLENRTTTPYRRLELVTLEELRQDMPYLANNVPTKYAIHSNTSDSVTIEINRLPQTAIVLYADAHQAVADLSGSNEPAFPESFHDVIIESVLSDEYRKLEKPQMAMMSQKEFERILSDLKFWIAKENALDIYQGKTSTQRAGGGTSSTGSSSSVNGALSWTQTGLVTFDRDPSAPFAVTASSAAVSNLNASLCAGLADNETVTGTWDISGGGLILPRAASPGQTTDAQVIWDSDDNLLTIGDGAVKRYVSPSYFFTNNDNGTQNNWNPGVKGNTIISWSGASNLTITGLVSTVEGTIVTIYNTSSSANLIIPYLSTSSSVGNRFFNVMVNTSTVVAPRGAVTYQYFSGFWVMISFEQGSTLSYTPTWGNTGTANSLGNGTLTGKYRVVGTTAWLQILLMWGSTTTSGNGVWTFSTPSGLDISILAHVNGLGSDASSGLKYVFGGYAASVTTVVPLTSGTGGTTTTAPFTWATSDFLQLVFQYQTT